MMNKVKLVTLVEVDAKTPFSIGVGEVATPFL